MEIKRIEYNEVLQLLGQIQKISRELFFEYLPRFVEVNGRQLVPPPQLESLEGRMLDEVIQMTNIGYIKQLYYVKTLGKPILAQNQPPRRTLEQRIIDGTNYMIEMVNEITIECGASIQDLTYRSSIQDVISVLNKSLNKLQKLQ